MSVETIIKAEATKQTVNEAEKETPIQVDAGLLSATDPNPVDKEAYDTDREAYLAELARQGVQAVLQSLFSLPNRKSPDGPLAELPKPVTPLPRAKPLPKPKPLTKWQRFAATKGINKTRKDRKMWDEEKQEWVNRWGKGGKNREKEEQWIHEVPNNAPDDFNPVAAARKERKERITKNEKQQLANVARAQQTGRKNEIERTLLLTKASTASMGKFDNKLQGEPTARGVKRKFNPNEISAAEEKKTSLALLSRLERGGNPGKKNNLDRPSGSNVLNVRKAIRFASQGEGPMALAKKSPTGSAKAKIKGKGKAKRR